MESFLVNEITEKSFLRPSDANIAKPDSPDPTPGTRFEIYAKF